MKRNMDLVRLILLKIEGAEHGRAGAVFIDGYSEEQIGYHVHLMGEAGLLKVVNSTSIKSLSPEGIALHMTWQGHDSLDAARSDTVWASAKKKLGDQLSSVPFDVLKLLLSTLIKQSVGLVDLR